jgi:hypothetical protein
MRVFLPTKKTGIYLLVFIAFILLYFFTSPGNTPYNYFTRLATSLLQGKYYLTDNPSWLSELITLSPGKYTFVNPIMPTLLLIPFVFLFKSGFQQQYLAHFMGAGAVVLTGILAYKISKNLKITVWSCLFLGLGSIYFYLAATGSVWYLGQVTGTFFLLLAIIEVLGKKRPFLLGLILTCAFLSRTQLILSLPFFSILLFRKKLNLKKVISFLSGIAVFALFFLTYNFIRFGNIFQTGYVYIPGILKEPWFYKGIFSLSYIPNHLRVMFLSLPIFSSSFPYLIPSWGGLAIWITSPGFFYTLFAPLKKLENRLAWITILLIALVNFSFGSTGFSQFGYRYAVDFYPFLLFLMISRLSKSGLKWHHWVLLFIGILVNLWGVLFINKLSWVGF